MNPPCVYAIRTALPVASMKVLPTRATFVRALHQPDRFYRAELYSLDGWLDLSVMGFATACAYVIVAWSPRACDHGHMETQAFAANADGGFFGGFTDRGDTFGGPILPQEEWNYCRQTNYEDAAFPESRVLGGWNPQQCLRQLLSREEPRWQQAPPEIVDI